MSQHFNKFDFKELTNKKVLITGAKGMLGLAFKEIISSYSPASIVHAFGKEELNVTDKSKVLKLINNIHPHFIIHCAALVNADYCEENEKEAYEIIVNGTRNIVEGAKYNGSKVFFPQSFLVFDGKEYPITETTIPNPLCVYGKMKIMAENILLKELPKSLVVRMAGFFGGRAKDKNFVGKIIPHINKLIKEGNNSIEIGDRVWQPTYTNDLAFNSLVLLASDKSGIYNMASHGKASFDELTTLIINTLSIGEKITVNKVSSSEVNKNEKARRPEIAYIENKRLQTENLDLQRNWQDSIIEYISHPYFKTVFNE